MNVFNYLAAFNMLWKDIFFFFAISHKLLDFAELCMELYKSIKVS